MKSPLMVAIVGASAAGKGRLARELAAVLRCPTVHIELDAFYRDLSALPPACRAAQNFDHPAAVDWSRVRLVFDRLRGGLTAQLPCYDFQRHTRLPEETPLSPAPVIIWDGLWLLDWSWCGRQFDASLYVQCDAATCLARRLIRDVRERGRTPDSVRRQFYQQVLPMQRRYVERQRWWADRVVESPWSPGVVQELARWLVGRLRLRPDRTDRYAS